MAQNLVYVAQGTY